MEQSIYELYMEQVNPQDTREIMQAEDTLTALLKLSLIHISEPTRH